MQAVQAQLLSGIELYREVIRKRLAGARESVWISTANVKEMYIERDGDYRSILELFAELCGRGVELRLLHAELPSRPFRASFDKIKALWSGGLHLKICPRVHFKAVIIDGAWIYLGSANLTGAGLGAKGEDKRNFELGFVTEDFDVIDRATALFQSVWSGAECASCKLRQVCPDPIGAAAPPRRRTRLRRAAGAGLLLLGLQAFSSACAPPPAAADDMLAADGGVGDAGGPLRSRLYPPAWTPALRDREGRFLADYSYAGYKNGELPIPESPPGSTFNVLSYGADASAAKDSTAAIQAAIDAAGGGGGGIVLLPPGQYRCDGVLTIDKSGVVLRGAGPDKTAVYFTRVAGMSYAAHLTVRGTVTAAPALPLAVDGEAQSAMVKVADAGTLQVGDDVSVGWAITPEFIAEHGMTDVWTAFTGQWKPIFRRRVLAIDTTATPHVVTLDVPLRYPIKRRDQAALRRETGYLSGCGVEQLALANAVDFAAAWHENQVHVLSFQGVKDGWVRAVRSTPAPASSPPGYHLQSSGILIKDSKRITVADCALAKAQNRGDNGNGYLFEISTSNEVLTRSCSGSQGRHNFIQNWDFGATGLVWSRCTSTGSRSFQDITDPTGLPAASEYHHSLAMACLVEQSEIADSWQALNRMFWSSGAGHTATQSAFWNNRGTGTLLSMQYGWGYVIGTSGLTVLTGLAGLSGQGTAPEDFVELLDLDQSASSLEPASLYEDQLRLRLLRGERLW